MHRFDWKLLESDYLYTDEWLTARLDKCEMPDGTVVYPYYVLEYADWVNVVALTKEDDIVLVRQYRHGIGRTIIELPCGVVEQGESAGEAMRRELLEETGYLAENMFEMAVLSPNAATNANMSHFFLARDVERVAEPKLDATEQIEVVLASFEEVINMARRGEFLQATHVAALFLAEKAIATASPAADG